MIQLLWGSVAAVLGLCYLVVEIVTGLHEQTVSYATVVLWIVLPPLSVLASMLHHRIRHSGSISYGQSLKVGAFTAVLSTLSLLTVWVFYTMVVQPDFFQLMQNYAGIKALHQHHDPTRIAAEIQAAQQIFSTPNFYVVSALVPMVVGALASVVGAFGLRKT